MGFVEDDKIRQIAEAYALDAADFGRDHFNVALDWSDNSIRHIESILDRFHRELPVAKPSDEQVFQFAKMFGSYVGEVFRRNHAAKWGMVTLGSECFPGMQAERTGAEFWPWGRVQNRLLNGPEDNVWDYYQIVASKAGQGPPLQEMDLSSPRRSWWKRLFGGA